MLPQNAQQLRLQTHQNQNQPTPNPPFNSQNNNQNIDGSFPFNSLDPGTAAKQMAALSAVGAARMAIGRPPAASASQNPVGGTTPAPYFGGISSSFNQSNGLAGIPHDGNPMQFNSSSAHQAPGHHPQSAIHPSVNHSTLDSSIPQSNLGQRQPQNMNPKIRGFLMNLSNLHVRRGSPLPPALTGLPYPPNYDPTNSPWKTIECSPTEIGAFRLAGKDIDLMKLWTIVFQAGGIAKVNQTNAWHQILPHFDLPEQLPMTLPSSQRSVAAMLSNYYTAILHPFEMAYRQNLQEQSRQAMMAAGRQGGIPQNPHIPNSGLNPGVGGSPAGFPSQGQAPGTIGIPGQPISNSNSALVTNDSPHFNPSQPSPQSPHIRHMPSGPNPPSTGTMPTSDSLSDLLPVQHMNGPVPGHNKIGQEVPEQDIPGSKRRLDSEDFEGKRVRLKTGGSEHHAAALSTSPILNRASLPPSTSSNPTTLPAPVSKSSRPQFTRTKVEYIPIAREVDTYGGRDLNAIEEEYSRAQHRPMRDINEWGTVDIEALTMSIRSRLTAELSYALTTFTVLSTMRGPTQGSGFPIAQCTDLLEEVLDLLEDEAFNGASDSIDYRLFEDTQIPPYRELISMIYDEGTAPFSGLKREQGAQDPSLGPGHRPGNIILAATNLLRNLSVIPDNMGFLAKHPRLLDLLLRICAITPSSDGTLPHPVSLALTLADLINVRKDVIHILSNLAMMITFPTSTTPSSSTVRIASRSFELIASLLVEPTDSVPPMLMMKQHGILPATPKPPPLADVALDAFTRLGHMDHNRQIFSSVIPQIWIWRVIDSLVRRLPVTDVDFGFLSREPWLCYLEKVTMAIYALSFLSPPELKQKIKTDRSLRFSQVVIRMVQKLMSATVPEARNWYMVISRRAIEALKVIDDGEDSFDTTQTTAPTLAFGMGFGESGETGIEKGTGLLGGCRDIAWDLLMQRDLEPIMFAELESLMRVE
ncbi:hypothetical protein BJ138DRAFT_1141982 [Hygrophoropsis aurantiaca]|uniref:Uncharacterized protein n=1 Tax=Hygrophoropsis aurantiaca TaxID=72124 RepID=A0ACB8AQT7_9AGAM|nr:hypothetical protein BJ138DRAFT_1141982 [Hygrophoropsis aurantiaca]